nr:MAG TPA: hypothetical protein [Caudoviricetes sp.]
MRTYVYHGSFNHWEYAIHVIFYGISKEMFI